MLKIHNANLRQIADDHCDKLYQTIKSRVEYLLLIAEVVDKVLNNGTISTVGLLNSKPSNHKRSSFINVFLKTPKSKQKDAINGIRRKNDIKTEYKQSIGNIIKLLNYLTKHNNLEDILSAQPKIIYKKDRYLNRIIANKSVRHQLLGLIFDYDEFRDEHIKYGAYKLAEALEVNTCPYCNRAYTFTVFKSFYGKKSTREDLTRPEFDHFFCKKDHPALSLSFFNLIPACHICNSTFKQDETFTLDKYINPFLEGFDNDGVFRYLPMGGPLDYTKIKTYEIFLEISTTSPISKKIKNHNELFNLENLYKQHRDIMEGIINKARIVPKSYMDGTAGWLKGASPEEIYRFYFSNYYTDDDLSKKVLSKLTRDLVRDTPGLKDIF